MHIEKGMLNGVVVLKGEWEMSVWFFEKVEG